MRPNFVKYFMQKFLLFLCFLLFASFLIFIITDLLPGDTAQFILGTEANVETLQSLREELNLNAAWYQRYFDCILSISNDWGKIFDFFSFEVKAPESSKNFCIKYFTKLGLIF